MSWIGDRIAWWQGSLPARTMTRFGRRRGAVLSGGIAYYALFSLFPALAVGFTVFGFVLGGDEQLQQDLADYINDAFGFLVIGTDPAQPDQGVVSMDALTSSSSLSITGVVGLLLLVWAGLGWLSAMGAGIQAMFDVTPSANLAKKKAFDLVALVVFGVAVLVSVAGSVIVTSAGEWTAQHLGLGESGLASWSTTIVSLLLIVAVNFVIFLLLFKLEARIGLGFDDLWAASLIGAIGIFLIQYFATYIFQAATGNEFLATFAAIVALLLWMNFAGRVLLMSGALAAEVARDRGHVDIPAAAAPRRPAPDDARDDGPEPAPLPPLPPGREGSVPAFGQRAADRTTIAAGFVLGATVAAGLRTLRNAVREVRGGARGTDG